jgi:LacI family transcriptional regulator
MPEKLTIQDIARLAGVSKATVSRVLNHNPSVDPELRRRVARIIQATDFVPNVTAIGLAGGRTRMIGVLAPPLTWPGLPEITRGIAEYTAETSYEIVLYSINDARNHSDVLDRILAMRMVAGLVAILPGELFQHLADRFQHGLPLVLIDDQHEPTSLPWVGIDNLASGYTATTYLLAQGHRRIAHILGPQRYHCARERYQGYCQALQEAGIAPDPTLAQQGDFEVAGGRQCAATLFARDQREWPTAIFAANDQMAYGVLEVADRLEIRVPDDVAVIGFDDTIQSAYMRPPLTTVHQPYTAMGYADGKMLLTMIDPQHHADSHHERGPELSEPSTVQAVATEAQTQHIQLPISLTIRASGATPRDLALRS